MQHILKTSMVSEILRVFISYPRKILLLKKVIRMSYEELLFKKVHVHLKCFLAICKKKKKPLWKRLKLHNLIIMVM